MKRLQALRSIAIWYCVSFTTLVLYHYFRGFDIDISWLAVVSTAPGVGLFLSDQIRKYPLFKPAEDIQHG